MTNERSGDEPLSASVGEQLQGKQALDQQSEAERRASARARKRTERRKAKERAEVAKHLGGAGSPEGSRVARLRGRTSAWLREWGRVAALPVAAAGGLVLGLLAGPKRKGVPVVIPLLAGWLVWRRFTHQR